MFPSKKTGLNIPVVVSTIICVMCAVSNLFSSDSLGIKISYGHTYDQQEEINIIHIIPSITQVPFEPDEYTMLEIGEEIPIGIYKNSQFVRGEVGMSLFARMVILPDRKINPFVSGILGVIISSTDFKEIKSPLNFTEQFEFGVRFKSDAGKSIDISFRLKHISNANIFKENGNFNSWHITVGYSSL
jgi:hypothetical protein